MRYEVVVGNIGTIVKSDEFAAAFRVYREYVLSSIRGEGRAAGESVFFLDNGTCTYSHETEES